MVTHARRVQAIFVALSVAVLFAIAASCTTHAPYRKDVRQAPVDCTSTAQGETTDAECVSASWEASKSEYDLFFAEFDDQGLLHPRDERSSGMAWKQIDQLDEALRSMTEPISMVVYVHGWKHDAHSSDADVEEFRTLLRSLSYNEARGGGNAELNSFLEIKPRRIVGVFIGWRGLSTTLEPLKELSFWDRKDTATRVAVGSARELFGRLRGYQQARNTEWDEEWLRNADRNEDAGPVRKTINRPPVQLLIIGHSFGAQLVYNALAETITESLASNMADPSGRIQRYGDMVILINPAFEATRFIPLLAVTHHSFDHYVAPLLVSITTTNDLATDWFFPLGRSIPSIFEHFSDNTQGQDYRNTIGHVDRYVTHRLIVPDGPVTWCTGWRAPIPQNESKEAIRKTIDADLSIEQENTHAFFAQFEPISPGSQKIRLPSQWVRNFCGGTQLKFVGADKGFDANIPIWNISTDKPIIDGHNGFKTPMLEAFLRQLYTDSVDYWASADPSGPSDPLINLPRQTTTVKLLPEP